MARLRFVRPTIANKMLLGYLPLGLLVFAIAIFSLVTLERMNRISHSIVSSDFPLIEATSQLDDTLTAQESSARRYLILRDEAMADLFRRQGAEFQRLLHRLAATAPADPRTAEIRALHAEYGHLFAGQRETGGADATPDTALRSTQSRLRAKIRELSASLRQARDAKSIQTARIGENAFRITAVLCAIGMLVALAAAGAIARDISHSVRQLKLATDHISEGRFDRVPAVHKDDELGELSTAFASMARRLKRLEELCLDANPLTRLPGGVAIEAEIEQRIGEGRPFAFCLLDLDNFKAYGDKYGYAKGSEVIKLMGEIAEEAVSREGSGEDFVGHIGGDDFVVITALGRYEAICRRVLERFDAVAPDFYSEADRRRGFIEGKTRQGEPARFPLLSLSIAVVLNPRLELTDPLQIGAVAAELKEQAKALPGSVFVTSTGADEAALA